MKPKQIQPIGAQVYFLPIQTRVPLRFGPETLTHVVCARVRLRVALGDGKPAEGWGETPLSVQWAWPSRLSYEERHQAMKHFCEMLAEAWAGFSSHGHPMEIGSDFLAWELPRLRDCLNQKRTGLEPMPWLATLVCCSAFDIALHDAYGNALGCPVYETYDRQHMSRDLAEYLVPAEGTAISFAGRFPADFLVSSRPSLLRAWHLVGGMDLLGEEERTGEEPNDGYPVLLPDWIARDGLKCLKVKLRGNDAPWDYQRLVAVGRIARAGGVLWLAADFNGTVHDPAYVIDILDRLLWEEPDIWQMILYVEQPFPYDLAENPIDVHCVSACKPLFLDESAHDWRLVEMGRGLGWNGVALKTCKTQTGTLLALCWAKAHGMALMVQDLTNPMLAQIPHLLLAAHAGTIMGVETNGMQFYPAASRPEATVHPGLYQRRNGCVDLSTISGPGFGYRLEEIPRRLPEPILTCGDWSKSRQG